MTDASACVVGAGLMGRQLAGLLACAGESVVVIDVDGEALASAREYHRTELRSDLVAAGYRPDGVLRDRLSYAGSIEEARLDDVTFGIEAVSEALDVKRQVVRTLEDATSGDAVFGTNTSSLTAREIADSMTHPERLVLFHFANPPMERDLVEIAGERAASRSLRRAEAVADAIDHWSIVLERERRGNGLSRLSAAVKCAATWELTRSSPAAIETAARAVGFDVGPIALIDSIGIDVHLATVENLAVEYGARFAPPASVREDMEAMVEAGRLGRKAGEGFFEWRAGDPVLPEETDDAEITPIVAALVDEAHAMVADGITDRDGIDEILKRGSGGDLGPFDLEAMFGADALLAVLEARHAATEAAIFAASPSLRERADSE
ncbi:MAG: 3-hydroxyacyl-CoA dehydrogenase NAD-binding domain-containing protein [Halobacteriaceae archaeon]